MIYGGFVKKMRLVSRCNPANRGTSKAAAEADGRKKHPRSLPFVLFNEIRTYGIVYASNMICACV